jgi:hypothetical protein
MRRPAVLWTLAALAGIVLVAGLTLAASRLSSQRIGLSAEPLQAGQALAPADVASSPAPRARRATATPAPRRTARPKRTPTPAATAVPTAVPTAVRTAVPTAVPTAVRTATPSGDDHGSGTEPGDDSGGHGRGSDD